MDPTLKIFFYGFKRFSLTNSTYPRQRVPLKPLFISFVIHTYLCFCYVQVKKLQESMDAIVSLISSGGLNDSQTSDQITQIASPLRTLTRPLVGSVIFLFFKHSKFTAKG